MSDHPAPAKEAPTETVTFKEQYLSYFPGDVAAFTPDDAKAINTQLAARKPGALFRQDLPPHSTPTPKDYDPQHRAADPNRPGNFATRQHAGPPPRTDAPAHPDAAKAHA